MAFRCEFDQINKILLVRVDGQLTDELLKEVYWAIRRYSVLTDARAGIFDVTEVSEFSVSSEYIRRLAQSEPAMLDADKKPQIAVVPQTDAFGLARMFQLASERTRPLFSIVRTLDEALRLLVAQSPKFRPIEF